MSRANATFFEVFFLGTEPKRKQEDYPDDFPHPSCLVFGYTVNKKVIHAVISLDTKNDSIGIITVYFPNTDKFENDLKTRKGR